jgi:hypothetical protein
MEKDVDFYFNEEGLMVFTREYHLKRGFCCKNKCKHCPWNFGVKVSNTSRPNKSSE